MKAWVKVALILGGLGAFGAWVFVSEGERQGRMTAETKALVTKVTLNRDDESRSLDETVLEFRFQAGGQALTGSDSIPGDRADEFRPGQTLRLCYNPKDTSETSVRINDSPCGG